MRRSSKVLALAFPFAFSLPLFAQSECGRWADGYAINQLGGRIQGAVMFDDGTGPALYVAGEFGNADEAPGRRGVAKWNGTQFVQVGGGLDGPGWAIEVFDDDGPGPNPAALYVGGKFSRAGDVEAQCIAKWDGLAWSALGSGINGTVYALRAHDDGSGPGLYAGGDFVVAGSAGVSSLAVWRAGTWNDVGGGVTLDGFGGYVNALESFQGGLYIGGFFDRAGALATNALVQWRNGSFSNLGQGLSWAGNDCTVSRLLAVNLPSTSGPALIVGGYFDSVGGQPGSVAARWNGSSWSLMNAGFSSREPGAFVVHDDGSGPALYAGGEFPAGAGLSRWNGSSWNLMAEAPVQVGVPVGIDTLVSMPGNALFAGGMFNRLDGTPLPGAARLQNNQWSGMGAWGLGLDGAVNDMKVLDLGDGPKLYAVGSFRLAGGVEAAGVARLSGRSWEALATGMAPDYSAARCVEVFNDGSGPALYVGGMFSSIDNVTAANIAKWRPGEGWTPVGQGLSSMSTMTFGAVYNLAVHQDPRATSPALFATGLFQYTGATEVTNVVRLTPSGWVSVGAGPTPNGIAGASLNSIELDGPGGVPAKLYFGGAMTPIMTWDGSDWTAVPFSPTATIVSKVAAIDMGQGPELYAGGDFTSPFSGSLAKRNDTDHWTNVGSSPRFPFGGSSGGNPEHGSVMSILAFADGEPSQTRLYTAGIFGHVLSSGFSSVARWDGTTWDSLGGGLASRFPGNDGRGSSLALYNDGSGKALFVGGKFERYYPTIWPDFIGAPWNATYNIAKWIPCLPEECRADFDANGQVDFFDYLDFVAAFSSEDPRADFDQNGQLDFFDYLDFIAAFDAGCGE